jgi:hypothetical protein
MLEISSNKNPVVRAVAPVTTNTGITGDYISMKNVIRAYIVVALTQAVGHATGIDPVQATAVAGTAVKAFAKTLPIDANEDCAASSVLVAKTPAVTYNVAADVKTKIVIFKIDAEKLDVANGFDCIGVTVDDSSQASNIASINYILEMRHPNVDVIVD